MGGRNKENPNHYVGHHTGIRKQANCLEAQSASLTANSVCAVAWQHD